MATGSKHSAGGTYTLCWVWGRAECRDADGLWWENTRGEERDCSLLRISKKRKHLEIKAVQGFLSSEIGP